MGKNTAALQMIAKGKAHSAEAHALARVIAGNLRIYMQHPSAGLKRLILKDIDRLQEHMRRDPKKVVDFKRRKIE
jgi:hypothetical protein